MDLIYALFGGLLLAVQLSEALSVYFIGKRMVGSMSRSVNYIFTSHVLILTGTGFYVFGPQFMAKEIASQIAAFYMISGFLLNMVKIFIIDPKAKESKIEEIRPSVQEFFGD